MALNIYKPNQGYWTRLLSGIGAGILILYTAHWLWEKITTMWQSESPVRTYVAYGVPFVIAAVIGWFVFRFIAVAPKSGDFLIATELEMKKVNWPVRKEVIGSTIVVIACVVLLTVLLFSADALFASIFQFIGILEKA